MVLSPMFGSRDQIKHFSFSHDYILPFLKDISSTSRDAELESHMAKSDQSIYGGYSKVRQIKIHPAHYDFGHYGVSRGLP